MLFSACERFVTALVHSLGSDFHCVFNLYSICDRSVGQLGVSLVVFGGFVSGRSTWWQAK